ncbi:PTS sugar transporter subunit IIA [Brucella pseudintermedia]|uniref:PTS sugar transporter subunit IIA n=1 Tax=Brucella pseudintermedia TaxID=370111 RepID=UPI00124D6C49|nr:PTS sugar transporter subunit IIA [Brucella pseudintermedia]KAB2680908.1 PTS sugar transporter subunit IIA [Brucella pseudintermedia]
MEVADLLTEEDIALGVAVKGKRSALSKIAARLAGRTDVDARVIRRALIAREQTGSTALGAGVAIPHALLGHISHPVASLTRLARPIDFDAPDGSLVDLLLTLLWPRSDIGNFLPTLANACRLFRGETRREMLRQARSPTEAFAIMCLKPEAFRAAGWLQTRLLVEAQSGAAF